MTRHTSLPPYELDILARTRLTTSERSPAMRAGNALLHILWHGWQGARRGALELALAHRVAGERRALAALDERELADVGLDRITARHEAGRHYLDLPGIRRR